MPTAAGRFVESAAMQVPAHAPDWHRCAFRFYAELNDFLPASRRQCDFTYRFVGTPSVKDTIQALGVPHTEVDLILMDGRSVGFDQRLRGGERIAVYPVFECFDIAELQHLRPAPLRQPRFALDVHLGKLARLLRLCGFDSAYRNDWDDDELVAVAVAEHRIVLTRDRGILFRKAVSHGYYVRATHALRQVQEVLFALQLEQALQPFSRCLHCNAVLTALDAALARPQVPPVVASTYERYASCPRCQRIYWPGSHYEALRATLAQISTSTGVPPAPHRR